MQDLAIGVVVSIFETIGIAVLVIGASYAFGRFAYAALRRANAERAYASLRRTLGRAILLGLEVLVAADIIRSVTVQPSLASFGALGLLVLIRTFLSWSLEVELEGQWPWQRAASRKQAADSDTPATEP